MADLFADVDTSKEDATVVYWMQEIELAKKREKKWRKQASDIVKIYEGETCGENTFNILYSNTVTLLPACYNNLPRPEVERRFLDSDPLGKASSEALERTLSYLMDTSDGEYQPFHSLIKTAVLGALVPGRGVTRFRYEADFEAMPTALGDSGESEEAGEDEGTENPGEEAGEDEGAKPILPESGEQVAYETICGQAVDYDEILLGYARQWVDMPWVAFTHEMTEEDLEENFGEEIARRVPREEGRKRKEGEDRVEYDGEDNKGSDKTALVYEIWNKRKKEVLFIADGFREAVLKTSEDPYKLSGFFPIPKPLQFVAKQSGLVPTPLYKLYEQQARELNRLSMRINRVLNAMKVRGFYDGSIQGITDLLNKDDNTLIPAMNVAALQEGKNLQNSIWMMPLQELIAVLQQLLMGREQCKQTIYEITGIADIMRGNTRASETATAQQIKDRWGSLRLQDIQGMVQEYVRECLRIIGELAAEHFGEKTFAGMTGLDYAKQEDVQQAQQVMQAVQQAMMQMGGGPAMPGQPPAPPQLPPQLAKAAQQSQAILAKPKWADVLSLLQSDLLRKYRIDIETNSTINLESQEDKQNVNEAMGALANMYQSFLPAVQSRAMTMPVLKSITLAAMRKFSFGRQVEEAIEAMPDDMQVTDPKQVEQAQKAVQQEQQKLAQKEQEVAGREQKCAQDEQGQMMKGQEMSMEMDAFKQEWDQKLKLMAEQRAMADQQLLMQIKEMLTTQTMAVDKTVSTTAGKVDKTATATDTRGQQQMQTLMKAIQLMATAVEQLTKATAADRQVTLMVDDSGNPTAALSRTVQ